jgi:hypothetical protein
MYRWVKTQITPFMEIANLSEMAKQMILLKSSKWVRSMPMLAGPEEEFLAGGGGGGGGYQQQGYGSGYQQQQPAVPRYQRPCAARL